MYYLVKKKNKYHFKFATLFLSLCLSISYGHVSCMLVLWFNSLYFNSLLHPVVPMQIGVMVFRKNGIEVHTSYIHYYCIWLMLTSQQSFNQSLSFYEVYPLDFEHGQTLLVYFNSPSGNGNNTVMIVPDFHVYFMFWYSMSIYNKYLMSAYHVP